MFRIVLILSVLTLFALPALNVEAAASMLERPTFTCRSDGASVRFSWRPASDASQEYLDLSLQDNGFAPGTYVSPGRWMALRLLIRGTVSAPTSGTTTASTR